MPTDKLVADISGTRRNEWNGRSIAFVSGNFNVIHPGHLRMFKFASEVADLVIIGVNSDDAPGVNVPLAVRIEAISTLPLVQHIVIVGSDIVDIIRKLSPNWIVKGKEFENQKNIEDNIAREIDAKIIFSSGEISYSDQAVINEEFQRVSLNNINIKTPYSDRHGFSVNDAIKNLKKLTGLNVLVIGDAIIDEYVTCEPLGMSQEDPTIVVSPIDTKVFVGGAGIVAAHARGLGGSVSYCTVVGKDDAANFAHQELEKFGVTTHFVTDTTRPTSRKQRFRAHQKTLLRVNRLRQHAISNDIAAQILKVVEQKIKNTDLIIFADFNYGCLPQSLVVALTELGQRHGVMMVADSQASSQMSDISRFTSMRLITPTEREARLAMNDFNSGLAYLSENLAAKAKAENVIITLGAEGLLVWGKDSLRLGADRLPAFNSAPRDPAGAGDSLLTTSAMAICAGVDIWQSAYLGAVAAALQVSRVGNTPLTADELMMELQSSNEPIGL
ncbi:MAG: PfkB family carbohydrate kinase [Alphaproteobacteria bacterium]